MFVKYHPMRQSIPVVPEWGLLVSVFFYRAFMGHPF